jgi:hypothetical protein
VGQNNVLDTTHILDIFGKPAVESWRVHHDIALWTGDKVASGPEGVFRVEPAMIDALAALYWNRDSLPCLFQLALVIVTHVDGKPAICFLSPA